jgi:hypothetical protein
VVKGTVAILKDFQDGTLVNPIYNAKIRNFTFKLSIDKTLQNMKYLMVRRHDELPSKLLKY